MSWRQRIYEEATTKKTKGASVIDLDKPTKPKPIVRRGNPFANLSPRLRTIAMARKALEGGGTRELGRLGSR
tara:strand:- start:44 stop:259 length:216 start_codon:yes stop_codon:yes gene_type:complete